MGENRSKLHYLYNLIYPVGILILMIIVLLTVKWGNIPDFVKYVAFGLTLTSLFLSLIAIIYMIVSQFIYSKGISVMLNASDIVSQATGKLTDVTAGLERKVESIPLMIKEVGERVDKSHQELLQELGAAKAEPGGPGVEKGGLSEELVKEFIRSSSFNGLLALYACQLAHSKKVPFNPKELWGQEGPDEPYSYGFLVACVGFGVLHIVTKGDMWNITEFSEMLPKDMRSVCYEDIGRLVKDATDIPDTEATLMGRLEAIDKYFKD